MVANSRCLAEVIDVLEEEGVTAKPYVIRYAIDAGHVERPPLDLSGRFRFEDRHVDALRKYLQTPRPRGRKSSRLVDAGALYSELAELLRAHRPDRLAAFEKWAAS